jgi:hypothetical protein
MMVMENFTINESVLFTVNLHHETVKISRESQKAFPSNDGTVGGF